MKKFFKPKRIILLSMVLLLIGMIVFGVIYINDDYPATDHAVAVMSSVDEDGTVPVTVTKLADNATVFAPQNPTAGFIFYPGGKVDHVAYAPLACALAERGVLCVLIEMPLRLAVLDSNAAAGVIEAVEKQYTTVREWYIGGHSLGGSMAASYAGKHAKDFEGLVLLAAYSTADLREKELRVLSVLGSEDGVLNRKKYDKYEKNLPDGYVEEIIEGGNHAGFGDYGAQDGDGRMALSDGEQIEITAGMIAMFIHARA